MYCVIYILYFQYSFCKFNARDDKVVFTKRKDGECHSGLPVVLSTDSALRGFMFRGSRRLTITLDLTSVGVILLSH